MIKLPRIMSSSAITDANGRAVNLFTRLWDAAMTKIEEQFEVTGTGIINSEGGGVTIQGTAPVAVANGDGLGGNPTVSLQASGVTPGSYGDATHAAEVTVDGLGRVTAAAQTAIGFPVTSVFGRTGAVVAAANDYSFSKLSGTIANSQFPAVQTFTWTDGSGASLTLSGTFYYQQAGKAVTVSGKVTFPSTASGAQAKWVALPLAPAADIAIMYPYADGHMAVGIVTAGTTTVEWFKAGVGSLLNSDLSGLNIQLSFSYVAQ